MKFLLGVVFGAVGMWAYQGGKFQGMLERAPEPVRRTVDAGSGRVSQAVNSDQVRQVTSTVQDTVGQTVQDKMGQVQDKMGQVTGPQTGSQIATPSASEVAGRPAEPLPRTEPE